MYRFVSFVAVGAVGLVCAAQTAVAGPDWIEGGDSGTDAGRTVQAAQPVSVGALQSIAGDLTGFGVPREAGLRENDFEDLYLIRIKSVTEFIAETDGTLGGSSEFFSLLYLFDTQGNALLANGKGPTPGKPEGERGFIGSQLTGFADDGSGSFIPGPGFYILGISGLGNFPLDENGAPIFDFQSFAEISGPDGNGGNTTGVLNDWTGEGADGGYLIMLRGVCGIAEMPREATLWSPAGVGVFGVLMAGVGGVALRRRQ